MIIHPMCKHPKHLHEECSILSIFASTMGIFFTIDFNILKHIYACLCRVMNTSAHRGQWCEVSPEVGIQVVAHCLMWMPRMELRSSVRSVHTLNHEGSHLSSPTLAMPLTVMPYYNLFSLFFLFSF